MALDIGRMRERVDVQRPIDSTNRIGEAVEDWETVGTRWASVESVSSREYLQNGQQQSEITHRVRLRCVDGITSRMRLVWRGRVLAITTIITRRRRSEVEALCFEDRRFAPNVRPPAITVSIPDPVEPNAYLASEEGLLLLTETDEFLLVD
jgi:SPP1 family predicted phage head-tail adaptor